MNINASLFLQMVVFFLGAWITMKYIWPPLIHAIEERQKKIADGLSAANKGEKALAMRAFHPVNNPRLKAEASKSLY